MAELDFRQKPSKTYNLNPFLKRDCLALFACARDDRFLVFFVGRSFPYAILSSILGLKIRLKFAIMIESLIISPYSYPVRVFSFILLS